MNVTSFQQSSWLNFFIGFNTEKRQKAANDFGKDFFKLMDKTIFGKTMENLKENAWSFKLSCEWCETAEETDGVPHATTQR